MHYKNSKQAISDSIKLWHAISLFSNDIFDSLNNEFSLNTTLIEMVKREAFRDLMFDELITNFCPLCDFYECSQDCPLAEDSQISDYCNLGCTDQQCYKDFQESILEKNWEKTRKSARMLACELIGKL